MQFPERHVLTVNKSPLVKKVLDALLVGVQADGGVPAETRIGLGELSKRGFNRLILNLQVMKSPFAEKSPAFLNLDVCEVGGVLVLTGQISRPWMLRVEELCRQHFSSTYLLSGFGALVSSAVAEIETAVERIARPVRRTIANLGRPRTR